MVVFKTLLFLFVLLFMTEEISSAPKIRIKPKKQLLVDQVKENYIPMRNSSIEHSKHHVEKFPLFKLHLSEIFNIKKFFDNSENKAKSAALCLSCKLGIALLDHYIKSGSTENGIAEITRKICTVLKIETARVCNGLSQLFKAEITQVLADGAFTPSEICGLMIGQSCSPDVNPLHNWTIPLTPFPKPPIRPVLPPQPGAPIVRVLHLSDTHLDPFYKEGSLANCNEPLCCRETSGQATTVADAAGTWGDYRNCDTPLRTLEDMLNHINKTHKVDYVIWTGDIPPHDIWNNSREEASYLIQESSKLVKKYLGAVPIFPALGNHESSPVNSFPIPQIKGKDSIQWLYDELVRAWGPWFNEEVTRTLKIGAYYSVPVYQGFRIISINMNYCNNLNWWLLINSTDPAGELQWLVTELQLAEIKGEKVHILGHIPPGNFDCLRVWSHNYYNIIKRYEGTVTAQFFGHTHTDEFEIFYDSDKYSPSSRAFSIAYIGPSITTYNGLNPGYRIYTIDGNYSNSSRVVLDHETYIMNLTEANLLNKPHWHLEYSMKSSFGMSSLLPMEWDALTKSFEKDDKIFQKFYRFYVKDSDYHSKPCDKSCKDLLLCRLRKATSASGFCIPSET